MGSWHQWLGLVGMASIVLAYFLLQTRILSSNGLSYSMLNALGAILLVVSLIFDWNLASLILESFWFLISVVGIVRCWPRKNRQEATSM